MIKKLEPQEKNKEEPEKWDNFKYQSEISWEKIQETNDTVRQIAKDTKNLENLETLKNIENILAEIKDTLLDSALGRKHIPLSIALPVFITLFLIITIKELKDSKLNMNFSQAGLEIKQNNANTD